MRHLRRCLPHRRHQGGLSPPGQRAKQKNRLWAVLFVWPGGARGPAGTNSLPRLPLQGLDAAALYEDEDGARYTGCQLMTLGLPLPGPGGQTPACIWYLRRAATCQDDKKG